MGFFAYILYQLIGFFLFILFAWIIMGWLYQFGILSMSNRVLSQIYDMLGRITQPILAPAQKILPPMNGIDISPVIVVIVLYAVQRYVLLPLM